MMLLLLLGAAILINSLYFLLFSKFTLADNHGNLHEVAYPVSVIICAKNEAENLRNNIPYILEQDYPDFELIIINDASVDETQEVIENFIAQDHRVKMVHVKNNEAFWSNKKYSLTLGIKKAKNHRLLFTDADCRPVSKDWIRWMTQAFSEEKQLVLGYGAYAKRKGILNRLIRYETLMTAIQYFSYAKAGMPYMGVGRNLAYTSNLFYDTRGFMSHMKIPSGDDDLFVNEAATAANTAFCTHMDAHTLSSPKTRWNDWIHQKKRHITTAKLYKPIHKMLLSVYYISNFLFWVLGVLAFVFLDWKLPLALVMFRFALQYLFVSKGAAKLGEKDLSPWLPIFELFLVLIQMTIFISNTISKPKRWK